MEQRSAVDRMKAGYDVSKKISANLFGPPLIFPNIKTSRLAQDEYHEPFDALGMPSPQILVICSIIDVHLYIIMTDRSGDGAADAITSARMSSRVVPGSNGNQRPDDAARSNQPLTNLKFPPTHTTCQFLRLCQRLDKPGLLGAARLRCVARWRCSLSVRSTFPRTGPIPPSGNAEVSNPIKPKHRAAARSPRRRRASLMPLTATRRSSLHRGQRAVSINSLKPRHSEGRSISAPGQGVSEILTSIVAKASRCTLIR